MTGYIPSTAFFFVKDVPLCIVEISPNALYSTPSGQYFSISCAILLIVLSFQVCNNLVYLAAQNVLACHNLGDAAVQLHNVNLFPCVLLLHITAHREVAVVGEDLLVAHYLGEMVFVLAVDVGLQQPLNVAVGEFVLVTLVHKLLAAVNEEYAVVFLALLENDDAGGNRGAEEKVRRQLEHRVYVVVVNKVLAYLLLRATAIQHAGKLNNGGSALGGEP